jgi:hypothetical protein
VTKASLREYSVACPYSLNEGIRFCRWLDDQLLHLGHQVLRQPARQHRVLELHRVEAILQRQRLLLRRLLNRVDVLLHVLVQLGGRRRFDHRLARLDLLLQPARVARQNLVVLLGLGQPVGQLGLRRFQRGKAVGQVRLRVLLSTLG